MSVLSGEEERKTWKRIPPFAFRILHSEDIESSFFNVNIADVWCFTVWYCSDFEVREAGVGE